MPKTSHTKNRPFDFKLIDLVEPNDVLYQRQTGLSTYEAMKTKNVIWKQIAEEMGVSVEFCIKRWSNLRGQYQKELRRCRDLCPREGLIRGSTWPYLSRLQFLESTVQFNRPRPTRESKRKQEDLSNLKCVVEVMDNELQSDSHLIHEVIENDEFSLLDAFPDEEHIVSTTTEPTTVTCTDEATSLESHVTNVQQMNTLLMGFGGENRARAERRIVAFLCKSQLRALSNKSIDDLTI